MVYVCGVNIRAISISFAFRIIVINFRIIAISRVDRRKRQTTVHQFANCAKHQSRRRSDAASNCVATHQLIDVADPARILAQRQDYPITKAIYELYQLLGDGRLIASALGVWAMCFLGTTMVVPASSWAKKLGAIFRV